ncbi:hypothetical protein ACFOW4_05585 [Micromonospora sp. GCM10011542]|uniref:hypothetical protein n=1 Tax=Micromonospora sp. GCM10011542 TaxID=3317337 RepID=UPI00360C02F1
MVRSLARGRRAALAFAVAAVVLTGGFFAVRQSEEFDLAVISFDTTFDPLLLLVYVDLHPDFELVRVDADEASDRVVLHVTARQPMLWTGGDYAEPLTLHVTLDEPLGERQVLDGHTGAPVPQS